MSEPDHETLVATLGRLAAERATGVLSVHAPDGPVVIELDDGTPVAIGPTHDVTARVGDDPPPGLVTATLVDELVDRAVAAALTADVAWTWDGDDPGPRVRVPHGLVRELQRRTERAAEAAATYAPDTVLAPANAVPTHGELDDLRRLLDGTRTLAEAAAAAELPLPTVATRAAALVAGGALAPDVDEEVLANWSDMVAAAAPDESDDDEPELWVMEPVTAADGDDEQVEAEDAPTGPTPERPAATAAGTDGNGWNDTGWLEELAPGSDGRAPAAAADATDSDDARTELGSVLRELQHDQPDRPRAAPPTPPAERAADRDDPGPAEDAPVTRREPKAEPAEVAEFLRELSQLAVDEDD